MDTLVVMMWPIGVLLIVSFILSQLFPTMSDETMFRKLVGNKGRYKWKSIKEIKQWFIK